MKYASKNDIMMDHVRDQKKGHQVLKEIHKPEHSDKEHIREHHKKASMHHDHIVDGFENLPTY